jgi:hypothetical protein
LPGWRLNSIPQFFAGIRFIGIVGRQFDRHGAVSGTKGRADAAHPFRRDAHGVAAAVVRAFGLEEPRSLLTRPVGGPAVVEAASDIGAGLDFGATQFYLRAIRRYLVMSFKRGVRTT